MPNNNSEKSARINCNNAGYVLVTTDSNTSYVTATKKPLEGLMSVDLTLLLATGKNYGDGIVSSNIARSTGATVKFGINKIPIEDRSVILGQTYENGILSCKAGDVAPKIAFYFEVPSDTDTKEQIWLYAGVAQPFGITAKQIEDNITFSNDDVTIEFKPRQIDKKIYDWADTANADFTEEASATFSKAPNSSGI
ncbi:MAG TPA: phage tail protein [Lachnoclostridium phytofermentans]|uniref:Phage tail protein n=1 Tax=Lachnoclostridium phytofermentans TaxID=66219 RepID=A0A3D2XA79_9FIRM|nr:major tail protein [Lachnoclostridium sp.]HCL03886.1 phage tail protein [Lachnoclostridium phytofermentans]